MIAAKFEVPSDCVARCLLGSGRDRQRLAAANQLQRKLFAIGLGDGFDQIAGRLDRLLAGGKQDVVFLDSRFRRRAVGLDLRDDHALALEIQLLVERARHRRLAAGRGDDHQLRRWRPRLPLAARARPRRRRGRGGRLRRRGVFGGRGFLGGRRVLSGYDQCELVLRFGERGRHRPAARQRRAWAMLERRAHWLGEAMWRFAYDSPGSKCDEAIVDDHVRSEGGAKDRLIDNHVGVADVDLLDRHDHPPPVGKIDGQQPSLTLHLQASGF